MRDDEPTENAIRKEAPAHRYLHFATHGFFAPAKLRSALAEASRAWRDAGTGRVLYYAKDIWPGFISCVLVVTEKLIREQPDVVRDLVRGIAESGQWAEHNRIKAARLVSPYFRQDEKLVRYVLTTPPDRVSYAMLTPTDADMEKIMQYAVKSGILRRPIPLPDLLDRSFIPTKIHPAAIPKVRR